MRSPERFVASHNDGQFHERQETNGTFQNDKEIPVLDIPNMNFTRESLLALI